MTRWSQKAKDKWLATFPFDQLHLEINPAKSGTLKAQKNGRSERSNPPYALREVDYSEQVLTGCYGWVGLSQKQTPRCNGRDKLTDSR